MPYEKSAAVESIDAAFGPAPLSAMAGAALARASDLGAEHAWLRAERIREEQLSLRDGHVSSETDDIDQGISVRVLNDGGWGFAAGMTMTAEASAELAERATALARTCRDAVTDRAILAEEPTYGARTWMSSYSINPFDVPSAEKVRLFKTWSAQLLAADSVGHVEVAFRAVQENKFLADLAGNRLIQQRLRVGTSVTIDCVDTGTGVHTSLTTVAPPTGRGWEYLLDDGWDWPGELAELPAMLAEKRTAPSVQPGVYDLVLHPTNLWLTIHESVGHATELDRALGYEAGFAGTSFATPDMIGGRPYGSSAMNVVADRSTPHGLASIGWDDESVQAQSWNLISAGNLVDYQMDRQLAHRRSAARSNGCAFADSAGHTPIQRMPNVSLQPATDGPSTEELIARVRKGLYVVGHRSWSIDESRSNFQFTGQRAYLIQNGRLAGQVRDFAYQGNTLDFWRSLEAVGGLQTFILCGAFNCGKGQPGQVAPVSHGSPSALFRRVSVINTLQQAGR
jgi:TldD protein